MDHERRQQIQLVKTEPVIFMIFRNINCNKYFILTLLTGLMIAISTSCADDDFGIRPGNEALSPWEDPDLVPVTLGLTYEASSTRAYPDTVYGNASEHEIDFENPNECFAIFFTKDSNSDIKKVKYIKPLYFNKQLTDAYEPPAGSIAEHTVFAVAYVPKGDVTLREGEEGYDENDKSPKLSHVLIVLNAGNVYKKFYDKVYTKDADGKEKVVDNLTYTDIANLTWNYPYIEGEHFEEIPTDGPIGFNSKGLFTMTNSAYLDTDGKSKTLSEIGGTFYTSIDDFVKDKAQPNATVQVERMVAKFSEPSLSTEIYGSERFFRPSDKVPHMVVYDWDGENSHVSEIDWRIHLLGWTINGGETQSFFFKKIKENKGGYTDWSFSNWNNPGLKRSYWSEDPHYNLSDNEVTDNEGTTLFFYPWQYRKAADLSETVSWEAGNDLNYVPALRYTKFSDIRWESQIYSSENTYDPEEDWSLDSRTEVLAGPHLLIAGELYLKGLASDGSYLPSFGKPNHVYCDRIQRYYLSEVDFFKMFVTEFQRSITTQWNMSFPLLDWENPSNKISAKYQASPEGDYILYYYCHKDKFESLRDGSSKGEELYNKLQEDSHWYYDLNDKNYVFREISFSLIDALLYMSGYQESDLFSCKAQIYQGDGRVIPWIENLHIRLPDPEWKGENEHERPLKELTFTLVEGAADTEDDDFRSNLYKSFIKEWWGPVDHFNGGRMYYAGAIAHQNGKSDYLTKYYGTVRNHWYKFTISSINGIGTPVSDPNQLIIPDKYAYKDQIGVQTEIAGWHLKDTQIDFGN